MTDTPTNVNTLAEVMNKLREVLLDGISHGFFEFYVTGEIIKGGKCRVGISAGKKHQFVIPEEELPKLRDRKTTPVIGALD